MPRSFRVRGAEPSPEQRGRKKAGKAQRGAAHTQPPASMAQRGRQQGGFRGEGWLGVLGTPEPRPVWSHAGPQPRERGPGPTCSRASRGQGCERERRRLEGQNPHHSTVPKGGDGFRGSRPRRSSPFPLDLRQGEATRGRQRGPRHDACRQLPSPGRRSHGATSRPFSSSSSSAREAVFPTAPLTTQGTASRQSRAPQRCI